MAALEAHSGGILESVIVRANILENMSMSRCISITKKLLSESIYNEASNIQGIMLSFLNKQMYVQKERTAAEARRAAAEAAKLKALSGTSSSVSYARSGRPSSRSALRTS